MVNVESESFLRPATNVSQSFDNGCTCAPLAGNRRLRFPPWERNSRRRNEIPVHSPQFPPSERNSRPPHAIPGFGTKFPIPAFGTKFPSPPRNSRRRNEIPVHSQQFPPSERNSRPPHAIPAFGTKFPIPTFGTKFPSPVHDSLATIPAVGTKFPSPRHNSRLRNEIPVPTPRFSIPPSTNYKTRYCAHTIGYNSCRRFHFTVSTTQTSHAIPSICPTRA
jgi:hypothetical protein